MALSGGPTVVLGMFRSGTSSVAGALASLGVFFGRSQDFFAPDDFNATGYYELREMMELNRSCLASFFMTNMQARPLPEDWRDHPEAPFLLDRIERLLNSQFQGKERWGWKEPQTCALLPLYKDVLERNGLKPHYVICARNPLDVLASQRELGTLPLIGLRGLGLWLHYTLSSLVETIGESRTVIVYEDFLKDPKGALGATALQLGIDPDESAWEAACATVKPSLSHSQLALAGLDSYPAILRSAYALCCEAAGDSEALNRGIFDERILALWSEWLQWSEMLRMTDMSYGILTVTWQPGREPAQATLPFAPTGQWQTLRVNVEAPGDSPLRINLYHMPSQVWIRRAVWTQGMRELPFEYMPGPGGLIEENDGIRRIRIFGPDHLRSKMPAGQGPWELEFELMLQCNAFVSNQIVRSLKDRLDMLRERMGGR